MKRRALSLAGLVTFSAAAFSASPTGLNVIPTTDLVAYNTWVGGFQNGNTSLTGTPFYRMPSWSFQSQFGVTSWLEAGVDYAQTPDVGNNVAVFNAKVSLSTEDETQPNAVVGIMNVANGQKPSYYISLSKTLNYAQEQEERFKAHHRRNRKVLGRRLHVGFMVDASNTLQPYIGSDLQLDENTVFQADWVRGPGNFLTAGLAYVMADQRTVINPALLFSNEQKRLGGFQLNVSHQFNL